uniref:SAM domain-containing protein n=1 Tax=Anisakis simplex TaxID=6269 RepID=A0A0M3JDI7_ANISI
LLDYGMSTFDETILAWLPLDGEDASELSSWMNETQRPVTLMDMSNDERGSIMEKMKDINGKGGQTKKSGLMARFRDHQKKKSTYVALLTSV